MLNEDGELTVYMSRGKARRLVWGAGAFTLLGLLLTCYGWMHRSHPFFLVVFVVGVMCWLFFGTAGTYAVARLISPRPALRITRQGIVDSASAVAMGEIAWEEIAVLRFYRFMNQPALGIIPKDLRSFLRRKSRFIGLMARINLRLAGVPFNIPQNVVQESLEALGHAVAARYAVRFEVDGDTR